MSGLSQFPPLVLTLALDSRSFEIFDSLRKIHFPAERNWLSAHLTLFHALPGHEEANIVAALETRSRNHAPMRIRVAGVRFLGRGVAYEIHSPELDALRNGIAAEWREWLTPQDRQSFRPHITIQNKVAPETARALYERLSREHVLWEAGGEGLLLWRYVGGPWELVRQIDFSSGEQ